MNVAGRKDRGVVLDFSHGGFQFRHRLFDVLSHVKRIGPRLLFNNQQQPKSAVDDRVTDRRSVVIGDLGNVFDPQWRAGRWQRSLLPCAEVARLWANPFCPRNPTTISPSCSGV